MPSDTNRVQIQDHTAEIFKLLVSTVQEYAIFALDPEGRILTWNIGAQRLKGYRADEIIGEHFSRFYTPEDLARNHPAKELELAISQGKYEEEGWRIRKDGTRFWANVVITALKDETGKLRGFAKITRDLTERKRIEEVRATELAYRETKALLNASPCFFGLVEPGTGKIIATNDLALQVIGKTGDEIAGKLFWECPWWSPLPESAKKIQETMEKASKGITSEFDIPYWTSLGGDKGEIRWVAFRAIPKRNEYNGVSQIAVSGIDITERRAAEEYSREAIRVRDEFLSIASHELKTPLTGIKIHTQLFNRMLAKNPAKTLTESNVSQLVSIVDTSVDRIGRLVEDMLDIARISNQKLSFHFEQTDLAKIVYETLIRLTPQMEEAGITIEMNLEPGLICHIDHFRWDQVLTNLVTNAIRYAPQAPVKIALRREENYALFSFQDHGPGIAKSDHLKIFKRFERLISANEVSGMGLGLFICEQIVTGHRGSIAVEGDLGQGTRFVIKIPLIGDLK